MKGLIYKSYIPHVFIAVTLLTVFISIFIWNDISCWDKGSWSGLLCGIATLLNAILLYCTLKRQDRSFKQERFETTFFNLLENHKKITEEMELTTCDINETQMQPMHYKGQKCFSFATKEVSDISKTLSAEQYYGFLKNDEYLGEEALEKKYDNITNDPYIEEEKNNKLTEFYSLCRYKFFNTKYKITQEHYTRAKMLIKQQKLDINEAAYKLLFKSCHYAFEFYFRSLKQLLSFIHDDCPECIASAKYVKIIISQMSSDEQRLVYYYSLYDDAFEQVLKNCKVQEELSINFKI